MDVSTDIWLNKLAQGAEPIESGLIWFEGFPKTKQFEILQRLYFILFQAGTQKADILVAIQQSKLAPTSPAIALMTEPLPGTNTPREELEDRVWELMNEDSINKKDCFRTMIAMFAVAHNRQRADKYDPEKYWWHRDLSDEREVRGTLNQLAGGGWKPTNNLPLLPDLLRPSPSPDWPNDSRQLASRSGLLNKIETPTP